MKRSYWRDFLSYMKAKFPEAINLSDVTTKAAEEYIALLRSAGRHDKTVTMHSNRLTIGEAAVECGFGDLAFFRKVFKRVVGTTPVAFRRLHSRIHVNTE